MKNASESLTPLTEEAIPLRDIGRLERFVADWEAAQGAPSIPELPPATGMFAVTFSNEDMPMVSIIRRA